MQHTSVTDRKYPRTSASQGKRIYMAASFLLILQRAVAIESSSGGPLQGPHRSLHKQGCEPRCASSRTGSVAAWFFSSGICLSTQSRQQRLAVCGSIEYYRQRDFIICLIPVQERPRFEKNVLSDYTPRTAGRHFLLSCGSVCCQF